MHLGQAVSLVTVGYGMKCKRYKLELCQKRLEQAREAIQEDALPGTWEAKIYAFTKRAEDEVADVLKYIREHQETP